MPRQEAKRLPMCIEFELLLLFTLCCQRAIIFCCVHGCACVRACVRCARACMQGCVGMCARMCCCWCVLAVRVCWCVRIERGTEREGWGVGVRVREIYREQLFRRLIYHDTLE